MSLTLTRTMRTNINLDDELVQRLMERTGIKTKRALVDAALREMDRVTALETLMSMRGKGGWEGDLDEMRADRFPPTWDEWNPQEATPEHQLAEPK